MFRCRWYCYFRRVLFTRCYIILLFYRVYIYINCMHDACIIIIIITSSNFYLLRYSYTDAAVRRRYLTFFIFLLLSLLLLLLLFCTRDYDKNPSRDTILWHSRLKKKNRMYTHRVNKFKFSLASYSIIRNVLFEQSWHLLNRYFILHVQSKGSKLLYWIRSI